MRGLIFFIALLFTAQLRADIQQRITIFTQQTDYFKQICFLPDGTFLADRILFDPNGSVRETAFDCNAQAIALRDEFRLIDEFVGSEQCPVDQQVDNQGLIDLLEGNSPIVEELACPGIGSASSCMTGLYCNITKSIFPAGAAVARYFSNHPVLSSCDGTGSCFSNLGKAIFDNLWDTVKGLYHIGSAVVNWAGEQIGSLWRAEDQTSTRGIAATEATDSELDRFLDDPFGYIYEKGTQLIDAVVSGISSRYGCAEWTGVPHLSECTRPMSWDCADCNQKLNMICGVAGYVGGNLVSNFFTGGAAAGIQLSARVARASTFTVARSVPGGARLMERMSQGGRIGRAGGLIAGGIRTAWNGIKTSRPVQGVLNVASRVNNSARKQIFIYARGQDAAIAASQAYYRLTLGAYQAGYRTTFQAAERTQNYLLNQFPRLSDINSGRYANVASPEQYLREATKNLSPEDRRHMGLSISTDAGRERRVIIHDARAGTLRTDITFDFSASAPVVVARAVPERVTGNAVEEIVITARRPAVARVSREDFVNAWSDRVVTTQRQNRDFIQETLRGEQAGLFYLDTQNTALKRLNDTLRNKQLVDSLGNRYNALVMEAVEGFRSAHPGVTVAFYSDYKSLRAAIRGPPGQEAELMAELGRRIDQTGEAFIAEIRANNIMDLEDNERWFRAGLGRTADEANIVTRFSRRPTDSSTEAFNSIGPQTRIRESWQMTEHARRSIQQRFDGTPLLRQVEGTDLSIPTSDVLEVVRKNSDPNDVARILSGRYNRPVTRQDAELLRTYYDRVDQFSPGLLIPARVEHRFEQATEGGFSIDFAGVGSVNAESTAMGLAQGRNVRDSLARIRQQEIAVTTELDALKARTERAVRTALSRHGIYADITVSGDDMLVVPTRALTPEIRREIAEAQVAAQRGTATAPSGMRTSFFREGIPDQSARSVQATIGESVEKKLRARLEGRLSPEELRNTLFAVDMRGTSAGTGGVDLMVVNPNLSPASRRIIDEELRGAIEDINLELRANGQGGSLGREGSFISPTRLIQFPRIPLREFPWISSLSTGSLSSATSL